MSKITESEIKSMTKEQNYMRGYADGKYDVLDQIGSEIDKLSRHFYSLNPQYLLDMIDKYKAGSEDEEEGAD